ncbi:MAG: DUF2085 domain-containing protein [Planctomycetota bacterium]
MVLRLLLSHHPPEHLHRTISLRWGGCRIHLCARCFGVLIGALALLVSCSFSLVPALPVALCLLVVLSAAFPALLDFHLQLIHSRESTNPRRVFTGAAFGAALALALRRALAADPLPLLLFPIGLSAYFAWLLSSPLRLRAFWSHLLPYLADCLRCREQDRCAKILRATRLPGAPV